MEALTKRKRIVLVVIDEQIAELEEKLKPALRMMEELNQLRATRAALLNERRVTSGGGTRNGPVLSMESVIQDLRDHGPSMPADMGERLGVAVPTVRSHLNRHRDARYTQQYDGTWALIGEGADVLTDDSDSDEE